MPLHTVHLDADSFGEILAGTRLHVLLPRNSSGSGGSSDSDDIPAAGDGIRAIEVSKEGLPTGREVLGSLLAVTHHRTDHPSSYRIPPTEFSIGSVRWAATFQARRPSSSSRVAAVVLCKCGHARTIHTDARYGCTLCSCKGFEATEPAAG